MNKHLIELAEKLNANSEYQQKIFECKNKEDVFNYCTSISGGYTKEELEKFIIGILSFQKLNKIPVDDCKLKNILGGIQAGTVSQISDKLNSISIAQKTLLNLSNVFDKLYFMDDIDNLSPQEMMQLTMSLADSLGMH